MHPIFRYFVFPALAGLLAGYLIAKAELDLISAVILASLASGISAFAAAAHSRSAPIR